MVLGLDAPIAPRLYRYAKEGKLPNIAKFLQNGVWAKNAMVPLPTITPPNWTSIATGAWPSTHGVTDFNVHIPGDPLNRTHSGFSSDDVKAEYVWNAIARAGKKSVVINYPTTWPPVMAAGVQIGGAGVEINQWLPTGRPYTPNRSAEAEKVTGVPQFRFAQHGADMGTNVAQGAPRATLSFDRLFATIDFQPGKVKGPGQNVENWKPVIIKLAPPQGWGNLPKARQILACELVFIPNAPLYQMETPVWQMLVLDTKGSGFDRVLITDKKDASNPMAELAAGEWSPVIFRDFLTEYGKKKACFRFKLLTLSADANDLRLYHSPICALNGWSYPESLADELQSVNGMPLSFPPFLGLDSGWFDIDTVLEICDMERQWWSDIVPQILKKKPWDLFIMHYHPPDHAYHAMAHLMDPEITKDPATLQKFQEADLKIYQMCDKIAGDVFACADPEETVFALVSDHGAKATNSPPVPIQRILTAAGLMAFDENRRIDWAKTKAIAQRSVYVYVNLKGRDPNGIVTLGKEYREVQEQIIRALTNAVDPATGRKPVLFALRKEDARFINIYGDFVGDVVYALDEHFGDQHGPFLPTAEWGIGSLRGVFALSGPGIKKGVELERNVWCLDMIPTLCYLTGWPVPKNAEGAIIYQALENPDQ